MEKWGGGLHTLGPNNPQGSSEGPDKWFEGSIQVESQKWIAKRTQMFPLAIKKILII